ncbi:MAG: hypothetical protein VB111_12390 [Clostridiaceae bacterium]|nr:hypothetical protein [Clostridiaceae bacterium]
MMEYREFLTALGIDVFPAVGETVYADACAEYDARSCEYCEDDFLRALDADFALFVHHRDTVFRAAALLRENEALLRFTVLLAHTLIANSQAVRTCPGWTLPVPPENADPLPYEMTGFFAELSLVRTAAEKLRALHAPEDVVRQTLAQLDWSITIFSGTEYRPGYNAARVRWTLHYLIPDILRIDRLEYEMRPFSGAVYAFRNAAGDTRLLMADGKLHHSGQILGSGGCLDEGWPGTPWAAFPADFRETDAYYEGCPIENGCASRVRVRLPKADWTRFLAPGDPVLSVHIPAKAPLTHDAVRASYARTREIFAAAGYDYRAVVCMSWLMAPVLEEMLDETANIVRFERDYHRFPIQASGRGVYSFLFNMPNAKPEELPADTTLRRRVRDRLLDGGYVLEYGGILDPNALT